MNLQKGSIRKHTSSWAGQGVVGVLNPGQVRAPGRGVLCDHTAEGSFQVLICSLSLTVSLGVKTTGETHGCSKGMTECFPYLGYKLWASVQDYVRGDAMKSENMELSLLSRGLSGV